jgi:Tol biopolymer transport system component
LLSMLILLGCGKVAALPGDTISVDAPSAGGDARSVDAGPPRCDPHAPFGPLRTEVSLDGGMSNEGASLSTDELTVWFSALRPEGVGNYDIYQATRADAADPFGKIQPVASVNTAGPERGPRPSPDGQRLYATFGGGATLRMRMAVRNNDGTFASLQPIPGASDPQDATNDGSPYPLASTFAPNDAVLYYHSDVSGQFEIYRIADSGSGFHDPQHVVIVGLAATDAPTNPVVTPDERTLYFKLSNDIWTATRASPQDSFHDPSALTDLSTPGLDSPSWISDDNCVLYLTQQDRTQASLAYDIYSVARPLAVH